MNSPILSSACFSPKLQWLDSNENNILRDINWLFNTIPKYMPLVENQPKVLFPEELEEEKRIIKQQEREAARSGKFLGMPIPLAIGLGVLLLGGISFGIYKLVKK